MKEYLKRIKSNVTIGELIYWWVLRALMIFAMVKGIVGMVNGTNDLSDPLQVFANLLAMFTWEVFMMTSEKTFSRHITSVVQDGLITMIFCASFCGKFLNFYYDVRFWDSGMHLLSGGLCVLAGYEVVVAMQKRDKKTISVPIALLCALGFSFFVSTCWELFEFAADQFMCNAETGAIGDAQHWCLKLAEGTPKIATLFDPKYPERWAIMDTMGDIVLNSIGAVVAWAVLKFVPYHHKGKGDVNQKILAELEASNEKEFATK